MKNKKWYKLDNVGKFYSSIADKNAQGVFRFSASLKDDIDEALLQQALDETIITFPNFNVNLKKGIFWYYLDETNKKYKVTKENMPICFKLYKSSNDFLYRVSYYKKRINFEACHIITDGRGSVEFFKHLVNNYIKLKYKINTTILSNSFIEKEEDSFLKYYKKNKEKNKIKNFSKMYSYKGKKLKNKTRYLEAHLPLNKILEITKNYNTTLSALIIGILIYSIKDTMSETDLKKYIKIDVPVDLRQYFKSSSSKNYFGLTSITYKFNSRNDTLDEIIKKVSEELKNNITKEKLSIRVNQMVAFEKNIFCRFTPIFIKNIVLKTIDLFTSKMNTSCVSNLGIISFNKEIETYIENVNILTSTNGFQFSLCSFKNDLSIGISSKYKYNEIIKNFCNYFSNQNIDMLINVSEVD